MKFWNLTVAIVAWGSNINTWETDFMLELFPRPYFEHLPLSQIHYDNETHRKHTHALIYNVENSGNDGKYTILRDFLAKFESVKVLVQLSDEWMGSSKKWKHGEGIELFRLYPQLALRQYGIFPYK